MPTGYEVDTYRNIGEMSKATVRAQRVAEWVALTEAEDRALDQSLPTDRFSARRARLENLLWPEPTPKGS